MKVTSAPIGFVFCLFFLSAGSAAAQVSEGEFLYLRDPAPRFHGPAVEALQRFLLYSGFDIGSDGVDGWFGQDTERAVKDYQKSKGLAATGRIRYGSFPRDLKWEKEVVEWFGDAPPQKSSGQKPIPYGREEIKTYFGSYPLTWELDNREEYSEYLLSPSGRFLAYRYTSPHMDPSAGIPVYVHDLLTGKKKIIYPYETIFNFDFTEFMIGGSVTAYYWAKEKELYLESTILYEDGSEKTTVALFRSLN